MRCDAGHQADKAHHHEGQAHELASNEVEEIFHGDDLEATRAQVQAAGIKKPPEGG